MLLSGAAIGMDGNLATKRGAVNSVSQRLVNKIANITMSSPSKRIVASKKAGLDILGMMAEGKNFVIFN